jgi:flagellar FliL protein
MARDGNSESAKPEKKSKAPLVIVLLVLAGVGSGGWVAAHNRAIASADPADTQRVKSILHLESFTVNLADTDQRGFLRIGMDLGLGQPTKAGHDPQVAPIRDAIISVLSSQTSQDLLTPAGKKQMKAEILKEVQARVPELQVQEIYFTEFLVQR